MPKVRFAVSGMCAIFPGESAPSDEVVSVLMDCPSKKFSHKHPNDTGHMILRHAGFVVVQDKARAGGKNRRHLLVKGKGGVELAVWELDRERLALAQDPEEGVSFNESSMAYIASIDAICPSLILSPEFAAEYPKDIRSIAGQLSIKSGTASSFGKERNAVFDPACDGGKPVSMPLRDVVIFDMGDIPADDDDNFTLTSQSLVPNSATDGDIVLSWYADDGADFMTIYVVSTPIEDLESLPFSHREVEEEIRERLIVRNRVIGLPVITEEVDFELYYELSRSVTKDTPLPIPTYKSGKFGGPLPGTDRCPPLTSPKTPTRGGAVSSRADHERK